MAKKKSNAKTPNIPVRQGHDNRFNLTAFGIDLPALLEEIKPHLHGTRAEIGSRAGGLPENNVNRLFNGQLKPSLGALAALAAASGGKLVVKYISPASNDS